MPFLKWGQFQDFFLVITGMDPNTSPIPPFPSGYSFHNILDKAPIVKTAISTDGYRTEYKFLWSFPISCCGSSVKLRMKVEISTPNLLVIPALTTRLPVSATLVAMAISIQSFSIIQHTGLAYEKANTLYTNYTRLFHDHSGFHPTGIGRKKLIKMEYLR